MNTITIKVTNETLTAQAERPLVAQSRGVTCFTAQFDESWDGYVKTIVFTAGNFFTKRSKAVLYTGGEMLVPWEVLEEPGELWISAAGVADGILQPTAIMREGLPIDACGDTSADAPTDATPEIWQQVLEEVGLVREGVEGIQDTAAAAETAADNASAAAAAASQDSASAERSRISAENARVKAEAAAQEVLSRNYTSVKVNGVTAPVVDGAVSITVPDEQSVSEMVDAAFESGKAVTVTLKAANWYGTDFFGQTVLVTGMTDQWVPGSPTLIPTGVKETDLALQKAFACVSTVESAAGRLKFLCYEKKPEMDVTVCFPGTLV